MTSTSPVETARSYYNSASADGFYATIWGGEDIHIGLYARPDQPIAAASHATVEKLASLLRLVPTSRILDIGAGYGGAARHLARTTGCHVTCLNLSEVQNRRNRELNDAQGLAERIRVVDGSFEQIPEPDASFDVVWSQDAILHSGDRPRVLREVDRVLAPGGELVFTDPMQADGVDGAQLEPVLERIHLDSLGSPGFYQAMARELGWEVLAWLDLTDQLVNHYTAVLRELEARHANLVDRCGADYLDRMKAGLRHWIHHGQAKQLAWGIFHFRKPPA
jgi:cyclopropane fatty-acyl-phospholipid synthase-like methyltransferase